jgi:HD-GYP domain-containing protein (c-di-GMP phosphodiesterase class II)
VVDVWDALRSDRPYRAAWSLERAWEHVRSLSGSHFDPDIVAAFLDSGIAADWDARLYQPGVRPEPAALDR